MSFGVSKAPQTKTPGLDVAYGRKLVGLAEVVVVEFDAHLTRQIDRGLGGLHARRQNHHIVGFFVNLAFLIHVADQSILRFRVLDDGMDSGSHEADAVIVPGPIVIFLEILPERPHVHKEDGGVQIPGGMLLCDDRLFDGVHTANGGTITVIALVDVSRTRALNPCDALRFLMIGQPYHVPLEGTGSGQDPLEFLGGDHVLDPSVPVCSEHFRVHGIEAGSQDHGADIQRHVLFRHEVVDSLGLAGFHALEALAASAAIEASFRFFQGFFPGQHPVDFLEAFGPLIARNHRDFAAGLLFDIVWDRGQVFGVEIRAFSALAQVFPFEVTNNGDRRLVSRADGRNGCSGTGDNVASGEDTRTCGCKSDRIGFDSAPSRQLDAVAVAQELSLGPLTDGHDDVFPVKGHGFRFVVFRAEFPVFVEYGRAALEFDAGDLAVFIQNPYGSPAVVELDTLGQRLFAFPVVRRHLVALFQADEFDLFEADPSGRPGHVDGHVTAADHDDAFSLGRLPFAEAQIPQEVHALEDPVQVRTGDGKRISAVKSHSQVDGLVPLLEEVFDAVFLIDGMIELQFRTELRDVFDFLVEHLGGQTIVRDTDPKHAACDRKRFENRRVIAFPSQVIRRGQTGGTRSDDRDLLVLVVDLWDLPTVDIHLVGHVAFERADRDGLVHFLTPA